MKKFVFFILTLLLNLIVFSQNGGQQNYNDLVRIDYFGYSGGGHVFRIKNLQPCPAVIDYTVQGISTTIQLNIFAYEAEFVTIYQPQSTLVQVKAKTRTLCGVSAPDRGWVEAESTPSTVLSSSLSNIKVRRIGINQIEVIFTANETTSTKFHQIKMSEDGFNYKTVKILTPSGLIQNKTYKIIINQ